MKKSEPRKIDQGGVKRDPRVRSRGRPLVETKTTRRILTKLGTIILHTPGQLIVYLGIPTGTGISEKILLYEKTKPRIDEGGKTGSTRTKSRAAASRQ